MNKMIQKAMLSTLLALGVNAANAQQYYSALDSSFGNNGIAYQNSFYTYHDMSNAVDVTLQSDGKMICMYNDMCHTFLMRLNADGTLDNSFIPGSGYEVFPNPTPGVVMFTGNVTGKGESIVRQTSDSKIIMGLHGFAICRLNAGGTIDATFGNNVNVPGWLNLNDGTPLHTMSSIHDFYQAQAGHYYVGKIDYAQNQTGFLKDTLMIVKTSSAGQLDNSYGPNGAKYIALDTNKFGFTHYVTKVKFTSAGKIMVIGHCQRNNYLGNYDDMFIARFNIDGTLDNTFGTNGVSVIDFNHLNQQPLAIAISTSGNIFVSGTSNNITYTDLKMFTTKLFANGTVDMSYGTNGQVLYTPNANCLGGSMQPFSMAVTSSDKLFQVNFYNPAINVFYDEYVSYNANGTPNTDFAPNGVINNNMRERATSLLTTPDNKILVAAADTHARLLRFKGDPNALSVTNTENTEIKVWASEGTAFVKLPANSGSVSAVLYSADGKKITQYTAADLSISGDVRSVLLPSALPHGIYVFSVHYNSQTEQVKFSY